MEPSAETGNSPRVSKCDAGSARVLIWKFKEIGATQVVLPASADKRVIRAYGEKLLPLLGA